LYASREDRNFIPIKIGSICVLISGIILNIVFVVNFHKQVKGKDKEFDRWRRKRFFTSNLYLFGAGGISLTLYRLIYCRLFRLEMMDVKVSKPQPFLRPILIFTWIKIMVFNFPLVIVDIYGLSILSWGNQCYMTMVESLVLSFVSLALLLWETKNRMYLISREMSTLSLEKLE